MKNETELPKCLNADPGEGYRLLLPGEIILDTDEYLSEDLDEWLTVKLSAGRPQKPKYMPRRRALPKQQEPLVNVFDPAKPVRTRSGGKARIVATDAKGNYPILALVEEKAADGSVYEECYEYTINGHFPDDYSTNENDLVNYEPEPRGAKWTPGDQPPNTECTTRTVLATNAEHAQDGIPMNVSNVFPAFYDDVKGRWYGAGFEPIDAPLLWKDINW